MALIRKAPSGPIEESVIYVDREFPDQILAQFAPFGFYTAPIDGVKPKAVSVILIAGDNLPSFVVVSAIVIAENGGIITYLTNVSSNPQNPSGTKYRLALFT